MHFLCIRFYTIAGRDRHAYYKVVLGDEDFFNDILVPNNSLLKHY